MEEHDPIRPSLMLAASSPHPLTHRLGYATVVPSASAAASPPLRPPPSLRYEIAYIPPPHHLPLQLDHLHHRHLPLTIHEPL